MNKLIKIMSFIILSGCTYSVTVLHNEATSADVIDDDLEIVQSKYGRKPIVHVESKKYRPSHKDH